MNLTPENFYLWRRLSSELYWVKFEGYNWTWVTRHRFQRATHAKDWQLQLNGKTVEAVHKAERWW